MMEIKTYIHNGLIFETTINRKRLMTLIEEEEALGEFRPVRFMNRNKNEDIRIYTR